MRDTRLLPPRVLLVLIAAAVAFLALAFTLDLAGIDWRRLLN